MKLVINYFQNEKHYSHYLVTPPNTSFLSLCMSLVFSLGLKGEMKLVQNQKVCFGF